MKINFDRAPNQWSATKSLSIKGRAYYCGLPYPWFSFRNWKTEELGPYPVCLPLPKAISNQTARWLFGKPPTLSFQNEILDRFYQPVLKANRINTRLLANATRASYAGNFVVKFSYDMDDDPQLRFDFYPIEFVRFYFHPHVQHKVVGVQLVYPFFDLETGDLHYYREDWTEDKVVVYKPMNMAVPIMPTSNPWMSRLIPEAAERELLGKWEIAKTKKNEFGILPFQLVKNLDDDGEYGLGDYWMVFDVIDRMNFTYHLEHMSNQLHSTPTTVFLDVEGTEVELDRPLRPNEALSLRSAETEAGTTATGKVELVEPKGHIRPHMREYAEALRQAVLEATSTVLLRPEDVVNKGKLTQSVMSQTYEPLVQLTEEKRRTFGEEGLTQLFVKVAKGLKNLGVPEFQGVDVSDVSETAPIIHWNKMFKLSEDEAFAAFDRLDREAERKYLPVEEVIKRICELEGIPNVEAVIASQTSEVEKAFERQKEMFEPNSGTENNDYRRQQIEGRRVRDAD